MATKFQIKRTSVSGRTPNTTNSSNSSYIAAGELALNLTDKKMYSSNGTNYFEIGAFKVELVNSTSNVSTFTEISTLQFDEDSGFDVTNPSAGVAKVAMNSTFKYWQVNGTTQLTATGLDTVNFISGNNITISANGLDVPQSIAFSVSPNPTFTTITVGNSTINTVANSTSITTKQIIANGAFGTNNQVLTSNGTAMYWAAPALAESFTITSETFTANGTATQFTLSQATTNLETFVFLNGVAQIPTTDYSISGTTLTFVSAPANNDEVEVRILDIPQINGIDVKLDSFVGDGSDTTFTLSTSLSSNTTTFVYLNGVAQVPETDYTVSGSTLTFTTAPILAEAVRVVTINPTGDYASDSFTANSTVNNNFTLSIPTVTNRSLVFINGVAQAPSIDYYLNGSTLILATNAVANDVIQVRSFYDEPSATGANTTVQYNYSGRLKSSAGFTFNETTNNVTIANTLTVPNFVLNASNPPANSTAVGAAGTFAWDSNYFYIATGTNNWRKVPISTDGTVGAATAGSNTHVQFNDSGTLGATAGFTFDKATNNAVIANTLTVTKISANGTTGSNGQVLASNGTGIYWSDGGAGSGVGISKDIFTGNGSNTVFTLSDAPTDETHLMVYVDRVLQRDADYNVSGTTLSFVVAPDNGATIDAYIMTNATQLTPVRGVKTNTYTGNGSNTVFTLGSSSSNAAYTLVFVDTVFQPVSEYTVSGTTITFNTAPDNGVPIEVIQLGTGLVGDPQVGGANGEIQFNSSNTFGANNKFTFNPTTTTLALGSNVTINTSAIFIGNSTVNTTIIAGNVDLQGTQLRVGNVVVNGNQLVVGNVTITDTAISVGNSTVNTVLGQAGNLAVTTITANGSVGSNGQLLASNGSVTYWTDPPASTNTDAQYTWTNNHTFQAAFTVANTLTIGNSTVNTVINATSVVAANLAGNGASITSVDAATVGGNTASTLRTYSDTVAATAFSNAAARADSAYSNAASYADTKAATAYSNATSYADTKAGDAYTNAVAYAASNTYVNNTFLPLAGGTLTGALTINATANVVANLAANNVVIRGDIQIDGNLTVSGTTVTLNATELAIEDNMIYLNDGSTVSNPDLGFAGNYNDGSYKHAGFFRDATDGVWKVFDSYTPEPDASAFIDTSNVTFRIADFTANVVTAASFSGNGAGLTSVNASSISTGTVAFARLPALYLGTTQIQSTSAAQAVSGITTLAAGNTTITGFANVSSTLQVTGTSSLNSTTNIAGALAVSNTITACTTSVDALSIYRGLDVGSVGAAGLYFNMGALSGSTQTVGARLTSVLQANATHGYMTIDTRVAGSLVTQLTINNGVTTVNGSLNVSTNTATFGTTAYVVANGNVGISTSSPLHKLHVTQALDGDYPTLGTGKGALFVAGDTNLYGMYLGINTTIGDGYIQTMRNDTATAYNLVLNPAGGNVGIGNTSPAHKISVGGTARFGNTSIAGGMHVGGSAMVSQNILVADYAMMARMYSGADAVFGHNVYADPNSRVLKQQNSGYHSAWIRMYYNQGIYFGTSTASGTAGDTVCDPAGTTNEKVRIDNAGRVTIGTMNANTTANTAFTVQGFSSNTAAFMTEFRSSDGTLRSSITDRGAQNWYLQAGDGLEKGSIRYSTPNGFVGILYFNSSGADRSDIRHVAGGGFTFHGHSLSTAPSTELMKIEASGNVTISGTLTELSSIKLKENITPIEGALSLISNINGYTYDRIDGTAKMRAGLIAEEVEDVIPNVVQHDKEGNPLGIQYTNLIAYLIESIKELKAEIDILKSK